MPKPAKEQFLADLIRRFPTLKREGASQSLFEVPETSTRIYVRYSKVHSKGRTFFGLRRTDLQWLEGHKGLIAFVWDGQKVPLLVPHNAFEEVFASLVPAGDGQYKVQVLLNPISTELYIATAGR